MKVKSVLSDPMDYSLSIGVGCPYILPTKTYIIANFKAPKLSGYLVDLSAVITQLHYPA